MLDFKGRFDSGAEYQMEGHQNDLNPKIASACERKEADNLVIYLLHLSVKSSAREGGIRNQ